MQNLDQDKIRAAVRRAYGEVARAGAAEGCCAPTPRESASGCCEPAPSRPDDKSAALGYSAEELSAVPEGANLGLGCGNPQAIASLKPGETVLDLGSGAGFDCFLAARAVGGSGHVIGVDMTPAMLRKARENAAKAEITNVEFRLGEIEALPVADDSVDAILSNCVINLSPDKPRVFREALRVLRPGGRLAVADVVATCELPQELKDDLALYAGCVSGAAQVDEVVAMLRDAGFVEIQVKPKDESREFIREWAPGTKVEDYVVSATIEAIKPPPV